MKRATLVIPYRPPFVYLGEKLVGEIGMGTINGPGGKIEIGETPIQCALRETDEEIALKLRAEHLDHAATVVFHAGGVPDFSVEIFRATGFSGTPQRTKEMVPYAFPLDAVPYDRMLESDRSWFPRLLATPFERFSATVRYERRAAGFLGIEFGPYAPLNNDIRTA